jgi:hypothetical protein
VGENLAVTKGAVVLQTSVFELIQYAPQTPKVRAIPLLMVPPVINKYYVMDLAPGRSMIEYFVQQGQQVFVISWRNPQARHRDWGFDTYGAAIVEAMAAAEKITGTDSTHLLATCSGGILAAVIDPRGVCGRGDERPRGAGGDSSLGQEGFPGRARHGGDVRLASSHRPGVAVRGEQLRTGPEAGGVRRVVLER